MSNNTKNWENVGTATAAMTFSAACGGIFLGASAGGFVVRGLDESFVMPVLAVTGVIGIGLLLSAAVFDMFRCKAINRIHDLADDQEST